ncbi:MAG: hypothetical protein IJ029_00540 [Lachnospiraceae bacterium]|nr:hypothetical protein [Lachnospiraceae bacterium]MBQ8877191.1 hypothetical protein [Lachnospiraceae bacterium]
MASVTYNSSFFSREVAFCKVYSLESKEKLEKLFLKNRISYFIEWQEKNFWQRLFGTESAKEKNVFTIRINEADIELAKELIQGIDSVKLRKTEHHN